MNQLQASREAQRNTHRLEDQMCKDPRAQFQCARRGGGEIRTNECNGVNTPPASDFDSTQGGTTVQYNVELDSS